jgi:hypothetical protein
MIKSIRKSQPLPAQDLAQLYLQLSRLEAAGIPIEQAMIVQAQGETGKLAEVALTYLILFKKIGFLTTISKIKKCYIIVQSQTGCFHAWR